MAERPKERMSMDLGFNGLGPKGKAQVYEGFNCLGLELEPRPSPCG